MFLFVLDMITNINKSKYEDLIERFKKDRRIINKALRGLKENGIIVLGDKEGKKEGTVVSKYGNGKYNVRILENITTIYSVFPEFIVVWPISILCDDYSRFPYVILIKQHAIERYAERYLGKDKESESLDHFIDSFCLRKDPVMIKKSETDKVDSLMCRIKDGALLGYCYKVCPGILRFNTFVSDKELEEANRKDQKQIRKGSEIWKRVQ